MLSFSCVACNEDGNEIDLFEANLSPVEGGTADPKTMAFWKAHPEIWEFITTDSRPPEEIMPRFIKWLSALPGDCVLAAHPLIFDGVWLDWYMRKYANAQAFGGPSDASCPFIGAGIDIPSYVQGGFRLDYFRVRPDYPANLYNNIEHTHRPVDDARGHAALFFNVRQEVGTAKSYGDLRV